MSLPDDFVLFTPRKEKCYILLYVEVDLILFVFFVRELDVVDVGVLVVVFAEDFRALDEAVRRGGQGFKEAAADFP